MSLQTNMNIENKRICFVIPKYVLFEIGGAEIQIYFLVQEFLRRNWEVEVVCRKPKAGSLIKNNKLDDPRVRVLYYKQSSIRSIEFFNVLNTLKKTNAYYYYQRTDFSLTGATALHCKLYKKKMVYACAQDGDALKNKYVEEFKELTYSSSVKRGVRYLDYKLLDKMVEYGKHKADAIVCQTKEQQQAFQNNFNRPCHVINNSFVFDEWSNIEKENIILWVGNSRPVKQPDLFVKLAEKFVSKNDWRFIMIGKQDEDIKELIQSSNLGEQFYASGAIPLNEVNKWYSKAKILVNTSVQEGMPNTFIQAWHYGLNVLSLNVNPGNLLNDADFGVCCNGDLASLQSEVEKLMLGGIKGNGMAKQYVDDHFNIANNTDRLIKIFEQVN